MGIPDHLTCLLRNLYTGQEATVRTRHGTTDWFQTEKGIHQGYICGSVSKESACNVGDLGSIPGLGRSPGEGKVYTLSYSGFENSKDYIAHGVPKSQTQLSNFHFQGCILSPCLFNLYAEDIMWNAGLDEAQWESRLPGEILITSDTQITPPLWQKVKRN